MGFRVVAGFVSAETTVEGGSRAVIDIPRGAVLPGDVPAEQVERFLTLGHIEPHEPVEDGGEPEPEEPEGDGLDELDKDALVDLAAEKGVEIDKRWGTAKIADAIRGSGK
jgi:hypothetical protein